jgi:hypothetical protein
MIELAPEQLADLADMLAERLRGVLPDQPAPSATTGATRGLVDAQTVAAALGVDRSTIYQHAVMLGGIKVGGGERGRWRFDLTTALAAGTTKPSVVSTTVDTGLPAPRRTPRRHAANGSVPLMAIRGER